MAHATIRWALATAVAAGAIGTGAVLAAPASAEDAQPTAVPTMIGDVAPDGVPNNVNSGVGVDTSAPAATKLLLGAAVPVALGGMVLFARRRGQQVG